MQSDNEIDDQKRLSILVGLTTTEIGNRLWRQRRVDRTTVRTNAGVGRNVVGRHIHVTAVGQIAGAREVSRSLGEISA